MKFKINACTAQHIGDRSEQQDRVHIVAHKRVPGCVMAVLADGMGGRTGGAMAAEQVVSTAEKLFQDFNHRETTIESLVNEIVLEAHTVVRLTAFATEKEPHSTLVVLILTTEKVVWGHVGDSRLYYFSGPNLNHRTVDHTYATQLVEEGKATSQDVAQHRLANVLTRALGADKQPQVTIGGYDGPLPGERFLLCSDGLWNYFTDAELGHTINAYAPRQACEVFIENARIRAANKGDNCSLAIIRLDQG
jgi:PPM family protein phosphatase